MAAIQPVPVARVKAGLAQMRGGAGCGELSYPTFRGARLTADSTVSAIHPATPCVRKPPGTAPNRKRKAVSHSGASFAPDFEAMHLPRSPGMFLPVDDKHAWEQLDLIAKQVKRHRPGQDGGVEKLDAAEGYSSAVRRLGEANGLCGGWPTAAWRGQFHPHPGNAEARLVHLHADNLVAADGERDFPGALAMPPPLRSPETRNVTDQHDREDDQQLAANSLGCGRGAHVEREFDGSPDESRRHAIFGNLRAAFAVQHRRGLVNVGR